LKLLVNFEMDSQNYAILILCGQPVLNNTISMQIHEALRQRIVINYNYQGLRSEEVKDYILDRLKLSGVTQPIFTDNALEAAYGYSGGSIRRLNTLSHKALMIGCAKEAREISPEIIMDAATEMELI